MKFLKASGNTHEDLSSLGVHSKYFYIPIISLLFPVRPLDISKLEICKDWGGRGKSARPNLGMDPKFMGIK